MAKGMVKNPPTHLINKPYLKSPHSKTKYPIINKKLPIYLRRLVLDII